MYRLFPALVVCTVVVLSGCGSDDDPETETTTTSTTVEGSAGSSTTTSEVTETTVDTAGATAALVGQWTADASETLAANLSNLGGTPSGMVCSGPIVLDFGADGTFIASGTATCSVGGSSVSMTLSTTGSWSVAEDGTIVISGAVSTGGLDFPGVEVPPIDVISDGEFDYTISGDTLSITFTDPSVGTVTQLWTRV